MLRGVAAESVFRIREIATMFRAAFLAHAFCFQRPRPGPRKRLGK